MKRTKKIQLVLISAALASCNRVLVPLEPIGNHAVDSTLTAAPVYDGDSSMGRYMPCCQAYSQLWNYSFNPFVFYYPGPLGQSYYHPGKEYRKKIGWQGNQVVVRGGWGKSGVTLNSSS